MEGVGAERDVHQM